MYDLIESPDAASVSRSASPPNPPTPSPTTDETDLETRPLPTPAELERAIPVPAAAARTVRGARAALARILHGIDRTRLAVVVGPCSIHDPDAALEYACRLRRLAAATSDSLVVVMRTYFEKPRTALGWKGFLNDPDLDGRCDLRAGLERSRALLRDIGELGVPCGSELLDPMTPAFIADLLCWSAIGARTSQSQIHREMASALAMPVGFKNAMDGDIDAACNGILAAARPHTFRGVSRDGRHSQVRSRGNPDAHIVLRGGASGPNYSAAAVAGAARALGAAPSARSILIDCSHGNSAKRPERQGSVCRAVLEQIRGRDHPIMGVMLESHLMAGQQNAGGPLRRGVSITDACIGWDETEDLLHEIAAAAQALAG